MSASQDPSRLQNLVCPKTKAPLRLEEGALVAPDGTAYPVNGHGVPLFATAFLSDDARVQQAHYDTIAGAYIANLGYPHTKAYLAYLDAALDGALAGRPLGVMAELACGKGEALHLLAGRYGRAIGVDVSEAMLNAAVEGRGNRPAVFLQADATALPLPDGSADSVVMLGGVHHIGDRVGLFAEIARILKPGGLFVFREPADDFALWRGLRWLIYRLSPLLDAETEAPLRHDATKAQLEAAGLRLEQWRTFGFLGFCLFMNSDVLVFNRLFRFIPGIAALTRASARLDDWITRRRALRHAGLQAVAVAIRPEGS